jgi:predicted permease
MSTTTLVPTILMFVAIVGVGAAVRSTGILRREDARGINAIIIYIGLPAFIFKAVHAAALRADLLVVIAVAWVVFGVMTLLAFGAARLLRLPRTVAGGFIIAVALGNTGYIGYPITEALFGVGALPEAIFYDVFGTVTALVLFGMLIAQRFGDNDEARVNPLRELATFPAIWALLLALVMRQVPIPDVVGNGLALLASMVAPLIMLSVGLSLRFSTLGRDVGAISVVSVLRLLVAPAVALGIGWFALGRGVPLTVTTLEAGMPTMMLTLVVGDRFGLDTDFIASAIFVTTALCAVTLPLVQMLATH